jgi:hypothetical protein
MGRYATYHARADCQRARALAATASPFTIEVRFIGGLTDSQISAFAKAADRWASVIVGDLPAVEVDGEIIDDLLILAQGTPIDGPGRVLGQAGPTHLRPASAGPSAFLPAKGIMFFDTADLVKMEIDGILLDVITHEMGHVVGIGTLWRKKDLLKGEATRNPAFSGGAAIAEYEAMRPGGRRTRVPVENTGGPETRCGHWRETVFRHELMSGFIATQGNRLSRLTVASLQDLGYQVDLVAAEPYELPDLLALAEEGLLVNHQAPIDFGVVYPVIPQPLPHDSLRMK